VYTRLMKNGIGDQYSAIALRADEQTPNGRTYPRYQLVNAIADLKNEIDHVRVFGSIDPPKDYSMVYPTEISHELLDVWLDGDEVKATIEPFGNYGDALRSSLVADQHLYLDIRGTGWVNFHGEVCNLKIITFDIIRPSARCVPADYKVPYKDEPLWF
jgi:hypothetical protein